MKQHRALDAAAARRLGCRTRISKDGYAKNAPAPIDTAKRALIVSQEGTALRKSSLDSAWQRMITMAIAQRVITAEQRFALHGMKHRGITDTPGTRGEKQLASGHKSEAMLDVYDHSVPRVDPASEFN